MTHRWTLNTHSSTLTATWANELRISPLLAQCMLNRGLDNATAMAAYLSPRLKTISDPFLLPDMQLAVDRLFLAKQRQESLIIFGDYDVDGITSTALLYELLSKLGWQANYYLPHRIEDGYGLSRDAVDKCLEKHKVNLILAVDCGSTAVDTIHSLKQQGIDVIVLDHHQIASPAPEAIALVNPQRTNPEAEVSTTSLQYLCSAGLAFKLAHALTKHGRELGLANFQELDIRHYLDLTALGTVADQVPLVGENRIFVASGLQRLENTSRPGLSSLIHTSQASVPIQVHQVAFQLAPRLNAAGRLEDAHVAINLLLTNDLNAGQKLAMELDAQNRERQSIERQIASEVVASVKAKMNPTLDFVIVEGSPSWHIGVVGIVASRVLRQFSRPTIIVGGDGGCLRGSGRSIEGFDLAAALDECDDLLEKHGGHSMAAGLSIKSDYIDPFRERLNAIAHRLLTSDHFKPRLRLDGAVPLNAINRKLIKELDQLEPVGQGNPPAQFSSQKVRCAKPPLRMGKDGQHVKLWITDGKITHEAVWWGGGDFPLPTGIFDLAYAPKLNSFYGQETVQLQVIDWQPSSQ